MNQSSPIHIDSERIIALRPADKDGKLAALLNANRHLTLAHLCLNAINKGDCKERILDAIPLLDGLAFCAELLKQDRQDVQGLAHLYATLQEELAHQPDLDSTVSASVAVTLLLSEVDSFVVVSDVARTRLVGIVRVSSVARWGES